MKKLMVDFFHTPAALKRHVERSFIKPEDIVSILFVGNRDREFPYQLWFFYDEYEEKTE